MEQSLAAVVLAAGFGTRLRPLTLERPKALCPVANIALVDHARARAARVTDSVAVNVHHGRGAMEAHLAGHVHLSIEDGEPLGTAGALGRLRPWIDGRAALVLNSDTWCPEPIDSLVTGWDGERVRLLLAGDDELTPDSQVVAALMPWKEIAALDAEPSGLYERSWGQAATEDRLEVVRFDGIAIDCGTPAQYLAANLAASGGVSVIGPGAVVEGAVVRSVLWPGAVVRADECLVDGIRTADGLTVLVRSAG